MRKIKESPLNITLVRSGVERVELLRLLDRSREYALTLLLAPPGSGKSTLLAQWRESRPMLSLASLSLTRRDQDPVWFFRRLDKVIREAEPAFHGLSYNDLSAEAAFPAEVLADAMVQGLSGIEHDFFLLIDDFQFADNALIHAVLASVLENVPPNIHVLLASRVYPAFSLSRLKLEDRVLLIDRHDLRFSEEEVGAFCAQLCPAVVGDSRRKLLEMTEGWAAGIKLALLAQGRNGNAMSGTMHGGQPELVDYFARVVLHELPEDLHRFLLVTSLLERFNADLCNALLGRGDCAVLIENVLARELFLQPVEERPGWVRYHTLFQEFLASRLPSSGLDVDRLHRQAAEWFLAEDDDEMALHHARQVAAPEYLETMLAACCDRWLRSGDYTAIMNWGLALPEERVVLNTDLSAPLIGALILSRRFNQARYFMDLQREQSAPLTGRFADDNTFEFQETMLQLFQHDTDFRVGADREALLASAGHNDIRAFSMAILAYHYLLHAEFDEALKYAQRARDTLRQLGYRYLESYADLILVLCDRNRGRMLHAAQYVYQMFQRYDDGRQSAAWVNAATAKTVVTYEQNQLAEARQLGETLLPLVSSSCATEVIAHAYLTLARILDVHGESARAQRLMNHLERVLRLGNYDRFLSQVLHEKVRQAFVHGDRDRLESLVSDNGLDQKYRAGEWDRERDYDEYWERAGLAVALWLRARGEPERAERVLDVVRRTLRRQGANARGVVAEANLVVTAWCREQPDEAVRRLRALVENNGVECLNRTALDEAPGLITVLAHAWRTRRLPLPGLYVEMFSDMFPASTEKPAAARESLTTREREILDLLRNGLSNREISVSSGLAVTTIKWHMKNIFTKLGVSSRTEAIVVAGREGW